MSKARIYIRPDEIRNSLLISDSETIHKIRDVLRLEVNEEIYVFDGCGKEYSCQISEISKKSILLTKVKLLRKSSPPAQKVTLAFPLEKENRVDFILQKAAELGVWKFIPFICRRSIQIKPSANKLERWQRIAVEAARQSRRLWTPEVDSVLDLGSLGKLSFDLKLVGELSGRRLDKKFDKKIKNILIAIGPAGDFTDGEYKELKNRSFQPIKLSDNLLRTETAAVFAVGLVNNFLR